jgi:hypothetical protein
MSTTQPIFCFTLDTEPDDLWSSGSAPSFRHFEQLFGFHADLTSSGARPTYLTTSEVVEDAGACAAMSGILATGRAEIGAHFHSWTRRWPFAVPELGTPPAHACVHQLGQAVEEQMLEYTCGSLEARVGVRPVSYRGGRWSLNEASTTSLRNCGILVDSTVTPGISWADAVRPLEVGPDFREYPRHPYWLAPDLLELPVGVSFHPDRRRALDRRLPARLHRRLRRLAGRPAGVLWLRPTVMSGQQLRTCLRQLHEERVPVWVAMIHSSEIGPNPYFPTEDGIARFRERCVRLVEDAVALGAIGATLSEAQAALAAARAVEP